MAERFSAETATAETTPDPVAEPPAEAEARLYACFRRLGIAFTHHAHPPFFTVEDSRGLRDGMPGAHTKNMFLKEKKGGLWLVTCDEDRQIRIRDLEKAVGAKSMSFARPELLAEALGVRPGAVTPFALLNDTAHRVRFVLDPGLEADALVNAHPLHNEATTAVSPAGLAAFLAETGHTPLRIDFDALEARARAAAQAAEETP